MKIRDVQETYQPSDFLKALILPILASLIGQEYVLVTYRETPSIEARVLLQMEMEKSSVQVNE